MRHCPTHSKPDLPDRCSVLSGGGTGFSLIEMMLVVMVIGLLVSGVALNVLPQIHKSWVEEAAARLGYSCQEARSIALSDNRPVVLTLDTAGRSLTIWKDEDGDGTRDAGEEEVVELSSRTGVTIRSDWTSGMFTPAGRFMQLPVSRTLETVEATLSHADVRHTRTVQIQGSGAVEIQ